MILRLLSLLWAVSGAHRMPKGASTRTIILVLNIVLMVCMFGTVFAKPLLASSSIVERPDDQLLILELYINDQLRDQGFIAFLENRAQPKEALIPLGALAKDMSVAINVDPTSGFAQGWFIEENNRFELSLETQSVFVNGQNQTIPDGGAEAHYDDIYVQAALLEQWFGLTIDVEFGRLRMNITSENQLPYEAELERENRAMKLKKKALTQTPEYDDSQFLPYKMFSLPSIVLQDSVTFRKSANGNTIQNNYSIQSFGDVAGFGTRFLYAADIDNDNGHEIESARLTFRKRDPGQNLLGPLKAGSIAFGDVDYPDVPLFAGRRNGLGVYVSSDSQLAVSRSFGPETTIIDGDATIGWDAELYRNGFFIDFQEVGTEGRYSFEDVTLIKGFNLFTIILYGPEGQKETQTQRIVRGAQQLREGEVSYEVAAGQPEADFIPIAEDSNTDRSFGASGQVFYGVRDYLTLGASVFSGTDRTSTIETSQNAASVSAIVPFLGFRNQFRLMRASEGRSGYDIETATQIGGANISLGHTVYDGFDKDDQDLERNTTLAANKNFGRVSVSLQAEDRTFLDKDDEVFLRNTLSTNIGNVEFTNTLERTLSDTEAQESFDGELAVLTDIWDWRWRNILRYDMEDRTNETFQTFRTSATRKLDDKRTIRINGDYNFVSEIKTLEGRYSQQFDQFSVDLNAGVASENNYFGGVTMRTALQPDHENNYEFVNARAGGLGSVGIRTYLDKNQNSQFDEGEDPIEGISFRSNRGLFKEKTDEEGSVFIRGLSESTTRFSLDERSLPSIYLKPNIDYFDIFPRSGATTTIDIGFSQLGEIDGFVYKPEKNEEGDPVPAPGIDVRLIDLATGAVVEEMTSEYDGYFVFSALNLGSYRVELASPRLKEIVPSHNVTIDYERNIQMDNNFILPDSGPIELTPKPVAQNATKEEPKPRITSGYFIQMGSYKIPKGASSEKIRLGKDFGDMFSEEPLDIHIAQIENDIFHRVVSPVSTYKSGKARCKMLMQKGVIKECIVMRKP